MVPTLFFYYVSVDGCFFLNTMVPTLFFYYVSVDGCCSNMPWDNIVLLLCQCGWLFFSKMPWFQHCSSIMSVCMVVFLKCHGSNIVLLLCQCGWLLF